MEAGACSVTVEGADQEICLDGAKDSSAWTVVKLSALFDRETLKPKTVKMIESELKAFPLSDSLKRRNLPCIDWNEEWKKHVEPVLVNESLWVGPAWERPEKEWPHVMHIDPGLAFGTGSHETTYLCLDALTRETLTGKSVIDFGCGSGILGIAACIMGARRCIGVDIDPQAVAIAKQNAQQNGVGNRFESMHLEEFLASGNHQFQQSEAVVANILAGTLIEYAPILNECVAEKGFIILSGVLPDQVDAVSSAFKDCCQLSVRHRGQWALLSGSKQAG